MSSDINELYRRVIYRNNSLTDLLTTSRSTPEELVMCQEKLVQEVVDTLLDNGIRGQPMRDGHNKVYKSFSDVIEGKEGRFRAREMHRVLGSWHEELEWIQQVGTHKPLQSTIIKLSWNAFLCFIWQERNYKLHGGPSRSIQVLISQLKNIVRDRLLRTKVAINNTDLVCRNWGSIV
ncbi:hypothetical protein PVK06_007101 [Gossypium arboreum]|uniref:DNA-directed RNA polymerase n=1 Tax=Gossypium arboreum TaxID=29729 RepID=A0ABR0QHJ3_GOSAR|nr:hypothetical protein PVK06_007101 [Gossypium arboreum]